MSSSKTQSINTVISCEISQLASSMGYKYPEFQFLDIIYIKWNIFSTKNLIYIKAYYDNKSIFSKFSIEKLYSESTPSLLVYRKLVKMVKYLTNHSQKCFLHIEQLTKMKKERDLYDKWLSTNPPMIWQSATGWMHCEIFSEWKKRTGRVG